MNANRKNRSIILFDGSCEICNNSIRFVQNRDKKNAFQYVPLKSDAGSVLIQQLGKHTYKKLMNLNTLVLIEREKLYIKSTAALRILRKLKGFWKFLYVIILIPPYIRDIFYDIIAHNRHKLSSKASGCLFTQEK